jgi:hypothetical protein
MKSTPLIAEFFGLKCTAAIQFSRVACIGFLGSLASLGFIPALERLFGFSGFFGFSG